MKIGDVIARLAEFNGEHTIYACEPWTTQAKALVARELEAGGPPPEVSDAGMTYFLEVSITRDFIEDWLASQDGDPPLSAICQRVIDYAIHDA